MRDVKVDHADSLDLNEQVAAEIRRASRMARRSRVSVYRRRRTWLRSSA